MKPLDIYIKENPRVTIILATYNRLDFLPRSIDSFLNQTYKKAELLIVDDGSADDTFNLVRNYMDTNEHIRYMRHTNRKLSLTKNAGITAAAGEYIGFLDSDDEYKPDFLEKRMEYMSAHPEIDIIEGGAIVVGDPYVKDKDDLSKMVHLSQCRVGATFFGKARVFRDIGGFDKRDLYAEDSRFWEKVEKRYKVAHIDHPAYIYYRLHPDSLSKSV